MKLFLVGPENNGEAQNLKEQEQMYRLFESSEKQLTDKKYEVFNPLRIEPFPINQRRAVIESIKGLVECDGIANLGGWGTSHYGELYNVIGQSINLDIATLDEWIAEEAE
jgi:hypothetical protein